MSGPDKFDDKEVDAVYYSPFGGVLFNLYTRQNRHQYKLLFSKRVQVVRRMIRAMLDAEEELKS